MRKKRIGQDAMEKERRAALATFGLLVAVGLLMIFYFNNAKDIFKLIKYNMGF